MGHVGIAPTPRDLPSCGRQYLESPLIAHSSRRHQSHKHFLISEYAKTLIIICRRARLRAPVPRPRGRSLPSWRLKDRRIPLHESRRTALVSTRSRNTMRICWAFLTKMPSALKRRPPSPRGGAGTIHRQPSGKRWRWKRASLRQLTCFCHLGQHPMRRSGQDCTSASRTSWWAVTPPARRGARRRGRRPWSLSRTPSSRRWSSKSRTSKGKTPAFSWW